MYLFLFKKKTNLLSSWDWFLLQTKLKILFILRIDFILFFNSVQNCSFIMQADEACRDFLSFQVVFSLYLINTPDLEHQENLIS